MDTSTINIVAEMGTTLTTLALKGTATKVQSKLESIRTEKNAETIRSTYDEIVNQLLSEREEAVRIAQAYKEELDKVEISDEDIIHLHNTVKTVLGILKNFNPNNTSLDSFDHFLELISVDTLKSMQLLGFNYKAAIGEPLTELCANSINNLANKSKPSNQKKK